MQMPKPVTLLSASAAAAAAEVQTDLTSAKADDRAGLAYDAKSGEEFARPHHAGVLEQTSAAARGACKEICSSSCTDNYTEPQQCMGMKMLSWLLPQRVVPVEHARECICSLVDASQSFVQDAIGSHNRRRGAGAGLMGLAVGSFCCAAAATKMRASHECLPQMLRAALALIAICGFARLFSTFVPLQQILQRPLRIVLAYVAATAISSAALTVAAVIAVATAARMYFRAAVDYGTRNEPQRWVGLAVDLLERGALLLQMILMTQWVFGEFSVMPVMTTMGMMFALLHNCGGNYHTLLWWQDD